MGKIKVIDLFCGAGGFTTGASLVDEVEVIACVNHDVNAIKSHKANHPEVVHFTEDVRDRSMIAQLRTIVEKHRRQDPDCRIIIWASLECTNFSKAKGGLPRDADSRTLADYLYYYIEQLDPDAIWIENVMEFMAWGPLDMKGKPISKNAGEDYLRWRDSIKFYGYDFDWRKLNAADYGARQTRVRYFAQFVRVGMPIVWPEQTHSKDGKDLPKWLPVKDVLQFEDKGQSIFTRKKPLVENTLKRIYAGLVKYVANGDESFLKKYYSGRPEGKVVSCDSPAGTITCIDGQAVVQCNFIAQYNGGGHDQRTHPVSSPLTSVSTNGRHAVVQPVFITKYYGNGRNISSLDNPSGTLTTKDRMCTVFIDKQYSGEHNHQSADRPAGTVLTNDKQHLVQLEGWLMDTNFGNVGRAVDEPAPTQLACRKHNYLINPQYDSKGRDTDDPCFTLIARMDKMPPYLAQIQKGNSDQKGLAILIYEDDNDTMRKIKCFMAAYGITDITMRMLHIEELLQIQGFPRNYKLVGTKTEHKKYIGNAVEVHMAKALIAAQASKLSGYKSKEEAA